MRVLIFKDWVPHQSEAPSHLSKVRKSSDFTTDFTIFDEGVQDRVGPASAFTDFLWLPAERFQEDVVFPNNARPAQGRCSYQVD